MVGKFYRFAYFAHAAKAHSDWKPHDLRDSEAFAFLADHLASRGLRYGGPILNHPPTADPLNPIPVGEPRWTKNDVVVLTTRPPLTDKQRNLAAHRRMIHRSWTTLEGRVFDTFSALFRACSRREIALADALRRTLPEPMQHRATAEFRMEKRPGAPHLRSAYYAFGAERPLREGDAAWGWSPVYLVAVDVSAEIWPQGPGRVLAAWGIGEVETLVFARMLNRRAELQHLFDGPRFFLGELELRPVDPQAPDFSFTDDWTLRPLLDIDPMPLLKP